MMGMGMGNGYLNDSGTSDNVVISGHIIALDEDDVALSGNTLGSKVNLMAGSGFDMSATDIMAAFITVTGPVWAPLTIAGPATMLSSVAILLPLTRTT
jgi:FlaG/FlaF family flagellin (archaellin)